MTNYQVHTSPSTPLILLSPSMHPGTAFPFIQEMEFPLAYNSTTKDTGSTRVPVIPFCFQWVMTLEGLESGLPIDCTLKFLALM
jgi:hypothetical protein